MLSKQAGQRKKVVIACLKLSLKTWVWLAVQQPKSENSEEEEMGEERIKEREREKENIPTQSTRGGSA